MTEKLDSVVSCFSNPLGTNIFQGGFFATRFLRTSSIPCEGCSDAETLGRRSRANEGEAYTDAMACSIRVSMRRWVLACSVAVASYCHAPAQVVVRHTEGLLHGFLVLRSLDGETLAHGELMQTAHGDRVTSHLVFHFKDRSVY